MKVAFYFFLIEKHIAFTTLVFQIFQTVSRGETYCVQEDAKHDFQQLMRSNRRLFTTRKSLPAASIEEIHEESNSFYFN